VLCLSFILPQLIELTREKMMNSSFPTIGEYFGRDHSTVIHANKYRALLI
jgi:chromosomal replication initiation ATPase DnaA